MRVETITITDFRVTAKLPRMPKLPAAMRARLQAEMAKRIEEMAYRLMTGGVPVREPTTLTVEKYADMFPDGNRSRRRYGAIIDLDAVVT